MSALSLTGISKSYNTVNALSDINLLIEKGELFGVLGPDGAGKTSLFRIIATLLIPDQGNATVFGFDTVSEFKEIRKIIGYMPGRFSLYQDLNVEENINFYATVFGTSIKKNYELIKDIYYQLEPFKKRLAGKLSGGMKQKLALCCALIHRPQLLILDEPTTGVDAVSRKEFWDLLKNIKNEGITIIVSTPYMDEAGKCDRVSLMQDGRIMITGIPSEIPVKMKKPLFIIETGDKVFDFLAQLRSYPWCHTAWLFGREIHLTLRSNDWAGQFRMDMETARVIYKPFSPGIEDAFMDLMFDEK